MQERRVGMRDLKSKLAAYIRAVEAGTTIIVTDHGRQVARIIPETSSSEQKLGSPEGHRYGYLERSSVEERGSRVYVSGAPAA